MCNLDSVAVYKVTCPSLNRNICIVLDKGFKCMSDSFHFTNECVIKYENAFESL